MNLPDFMLGYCSLRSQQERAGNFLLPSGRLSNSMVRVMLSRDITIDSICTQTHINVYIQLPLQPLQWHTGFKLASYIPQPFLCVSTYVRNIGKAWPICEHICHHFHRPWQKWWQIRTSQNQPGLPDSSHVCWKYGKGLGTRLSLNHASPTIRLKNNTSTTK